MLRFVFFTSLLLLFSTHSFAQDEPIGYLKFAYPKSREVTQALNPQADILNDSEGAFDRAPSGSAARTLSVFAFPFPGAEKIAEVDTAGAIRILRAIARPGQYVIDPESEERVFKNGSVKILVFERRKDWMRVQFQLSPPWNGQDGWVKAGVESGVFEELQ